MALHAEIAERAVALLLGAFVHGQENGILGGVGMHAARPVAELLGVAALAARRIHQFGPGEPLHLDFIAAAR